MNLSDHFTLEEFCRSETAARRGLPNVPPRELLPAMQNTAAGLERVRALVGAPIHITSGYRSVPVNFAIGGAVTSQHVKGEAADINAQGLSPRELARFIMAHAEAIRFDQLILEFDQWVHVSFTRGAPRGEVLHILKRSEGYRKGLP